MNVKKAASIIVSAVIAAGIGIGVYVSSSQGYGEYYEYYEEISKLNVVAFNNKLADSGNDPWVIWHEQTACYYYCYSDNDGVCVAKMDNIYELSYAVGETVWVPDESIIPEYSKELLAPELHFINNKWYIYVAADDGNNENHRMICLESNTADPLDGFKFKSVLRAETDRWAIDGTVLQYDEELYFIWSGWQGKINVSQNIYIAKMKNPWTIEGDRVCISKPTESWEKNGTPLVNEGPTVLQYDGRVYIVYSASNSRTDDYCLGLLTLTGSNLLDEDSWKKKDEPVFEKTDSIFGPGYASFTTSPDGSKWYIIYQANEKSGTGRTGRSVWAQEFCFDSFGNPEFGKPMPAGTVQYTYENEINEFDESTHS